MPLQQLQKKAGVTMANDASNLGTVDWDLLNDVQYGNDLRTVTGNIAAAGGLSKFLRVTGFGFSIPTGARIDGFLVEIEGHASVTPLQWQAQIVSAGTWTGSTKTASANASTDAAHALGGSTDVWGTSWGVDDVNGSSFGVGIAGQNNNGSLASVARLDLVEMTVFYTPAAELLRDPSSRFHPRRRLRRN